MTVQASTTYLLKVWRPVTGGFRAHLRAVDQESALVFDNAHALAEYLQAHARPVTAPAATPCAVELCDERRGDLLGC